MGRAGFSWLLYPRNNHCNNNTVIEAESERDDSGMSFSAMVYVVWCPL
jgi:hypothetical protein